MIFSMARLGGVTSLFNAESKSISVIVGSAERIVDRARRSREPARAFRRHVEAIFEADPELPGKVDSRLVGKAHAGGERRGLAVDEVDRLVPVHADSVAGSVRGAGEPVARPVAPAFILGAHRIVDASGEPADPRRAHRDLLPLADLVPDPALRRIRLAEDEGARDVRLVAMDAAAAIEQHDLPGANRLGLARAVGIGAGLAEQDEAAVGAG